MQSSSSSLSRGARTFADAAAEVAKTLRSRASVGRYFSDQYIHALIALAQGRSVGNLLMLPDDSVQLKPWAGTSASSSPLTVFSDLERLGHGAMSVVMTDATVPRRHVYKVSLRDLNEPHQYRRRQHQQQQQQLPSPQAPYSETVREVIIGAVLAEIGKGVRQDILVNEMLIPTDALFYWRPSARLRDILLRSAPDKDLKTRYPVTLAFQQSGHAAVLPAIDIVEMLPAAMQSTARQQLVDIDISTKGGDNDEYLRQQYIGMMLHLAKGRATEFPGYAIQRQAYVDGRTLASMLQSDWLKADIAQGQVVIKFLYLVFSALAYFAREYGYVHNDLSTANILVKQMAPAASNIPAGFNQNGVAAQYDPATGGFTHLITPAEVGRFTPVIIDNGRAAIREDVIQKYAGHLVEARHTIIHWWPALFGSQDVRRLALSVFRSMLQAVDRRLRQYHQARPDQYKLVDDTLVQPASLDAAGTLVLGLMSIMSFAVVHFAVRGSSFPAKWTACALAAVGDDSGREQAARKLFMRHVRRYERYGRELLIFLRGAVDSRTRKPIVGRYNIDPPVGETATNTRRMLFSFNAARACLTSIDYVLDRLTATLRQLKGSEDLAKVELEYTPEKVRQWSMFHYA